VKSGLSSSSCQHLVDKVASIQSTKESQSSLVLLKGSLAGAIGEIHIDSIVDYESSVVRIDYYVGLSSVT